MKPRQGIGAVALAAALWSTAGAAWAQAGVTERVGQSRVTTVPAPLPQAVPAGQGVRPSTVARPSIALPTSPVAPAAPTALPTPSLSRSDVEAAPVAPSLAAHGMPITAMAAPAAGLTAEAAPAEKSAKPKHGARQAPTLQKTRPGLRKPADTEPTLRPEPTPVRKPTAQATGKAPAKPTAKAPIHTTPTKAVTPTAPRSPALHAAAGKPQRADKTRHKPGRRLNDGSQP